MPKLSDTQKAKLAAEKKAYKAEREELKKINAKLDRDFRMEFEKAKMVNKGPEEQKKLAALRKKYRKADKEYGFVIRFSRRDLAIYKERNEVKEKIFNKFVKSGLIKGDRLRKETPSKEVPGIAARDKIYQGDLKDEFRVLEDVFRKMAELELLQKDPLMKRRYDKLDSEVEKMLKGFLAFATMEREHPLSVYQVRQKAEECQRACDEAYKLIDDFKAGYADHQAKMKTSVHPRTIIAETGLSKVIGQVSQKRDALKKEMDGLKKQQFHSPNDTKRFLTLLGEFNELKTLLESCKEKSSVATHQKNVERCDELMGKIEAFKQALKAKQADVVKHSLHEEARPRPPTLKRG